LMVGAPTINGNRRSINPIGLRTASQQASQG
jgi:hypothetical protein